MSLSWCNVTLACLYTSISLYTSFLRDRIQFYCEKQMKYDIIRLDIHYVFFVICKCYEIYINKCVLSVQVLLCGIDLSTKHNIISSFIVLIVLQLVLPYIFRTP